jgi:hypothetical protein
MLSNAAVKPMRDGVASSWLKHSMVLYSLVTVLTPGPCAAIWSVQKLPGIKVGLQQAAYVPDVTDNCLSGQYWHKKAGGRRIWCNCLCFSGMFYLAGTSRTCTGI